MSRLPDYVILSALSLQSVILYKVKQCKRSVRTLGISTKGVELEHQQQCSVCSFRPK